MYLKGIKDHHLQLILQYVYQGSVAVNEADIKDVLEAAKSLKINGLGEGLDNSQSSVEEKVERKVVPKPSEISKRKKPNESPWNWDLPQDVDVLDEATDVSAAIEEDEIIPKIKKNEIEEMKPKKKKISKEDGVFSYSNYMKRFECDSCDGSYASQGALYNHKKAKHEGVAYNCNICDFTCQQKNSLKVHMSKKHDCGVIDYKNTTL